jgi:hypothetical protein
VAAHVANWRAAGLENVKVKPMSFGGGLIMSAIRGDGAGVARPASAGVVSG